MPSDAVTVAPHLYTVVLENERVRVLAVRGKPGDKTERHAHPAYLAIAITDGKFRFTRPDGQAVDVEFKAGQAIYQNPVEHTTEITGTTEAHVILVELK
jgi:beta-alanine degradation protein BauB